MFVITVTVLAKAQPKQPASFVFTDFENFSGWTNSVIAFITGFINANYSFSCLDAATHIAEEIPHPERNIPKALLTIPVIGVLSSLFYNISMVSHLRCSLLTPSSFQFKIMTPLSGRRRGIRLFSFITKPSRTLAAPSFCKSCSYVPASSVSSVFTPGNLEWYDPPSPTIEIMMRCGRLPVTKRSPSPVRGPKSIPVSASRSTRTSPVTPSSYFSEHCMLHLPLLSIHLSSALSSSSI